MEDRFGEWVSAAVTDRGLDGPVLGGYIASVVAAPDCDLDDKREQLADLLGDMPLVDLIMDKWSALERSPLQPSPPPESCADRLDDRLVQLLGSQCPVVAAPKSYTDEEKRLREAILKYARIDNGDEEGEGGGAGADADTHQTQPREGDLVPNTNASNVAAQARLRREQAKQESQRKKEKDKEDREKQKQLREEKKEKRKTQKGERKR